MCDLRDDYHCDRAGLAHSFVPRLKHNCVALEMAGAPRWSAGEQQDVSEFLQALVRVMDRSIASPEVAVQFYERFGIVLQTRIQCAACTWQSDWVSDGDTASFILRIKRWTPGCNLADAVQRELSQEDLADYTCPHCSAVGSSARLWRFARLPPFLFIQIDRVQHSGHGAAAAKRRGCVRLPLALPLTCFEESAEYSLVAVACHSGASPNVGHWVTWRRGLTVNSESVPWLIDDDDNRRLPGVAASLQENLLK